MMRPRSVPRSSKAISCLAVGMVITGLGLGGSGGCSGSRGSAAPNGGATDGGGSGGDSGVSASGGGGSPGSGGRAGVGGMSGSGGMMDVPMTSGMTGGMTGGAGGGAAPRGTLDIYWIDVEGGAATLLVAPTGETVLVDGGFPGNGDRDLNRVLALLANEVHAVKLDYVITTHFHSDHVGGITALAGRFPVGQFLDHGASVEGGALYSGYVNALVGKSRVTVKAGDRVSLGAVELLFVSSAGEVIEPLPTALANSRCATAPQMAERPSDENARSVGFLARFGSFDFLDLGDLTWAVENRLACPTNRIGTVDLLQVSHHGLELSSAPQLVHSLAPLVAVMNNGATKGGAASTFDTFRGAPGLQDLWALHRATNNDALHNAAEALTANITNSPDGANFVKASVSADGSFTVTNARNNETRGYRAR